MTAMHFEFSVGSKPPKFQSSPFGGLKAQHLLIPNYNAVLSSLRHRPPHADAAAAASRRCNVVFLAREISG